MSLSKSKQLENNLSIEAVLFLVKTSHATCILRDS